jgi:uncharacterized membrane protein
MELKNKKSRIWELDFLRGFAIIMVIIDHSLYDFSIAFSQWSTSGVAFLENISSIGRSYMFSDIRIFWRPAFLFLFFCTSGLCTAFSKNNLFRGLKLAFIAMLISFISYYSELLLGTNTFILFGVLHCMAFIIIFYSIVAFILQSLTKICYKIAKKEYTDKIYKYILSIACIILSIVFFAINNKYNVGLVDATGYFDTVDTDSKILGLFFYTKNWWTSDYFPVFPFICFFFLGAGLTNFLYNNKKSLFPQLDGCWHKPFSFAGRYSLFFYIGGQAAALLIGSLLNLIFLGSIY